MSFFGGFNPQKLKPQLKMACGRIQIASNKKSALLKQSMREVALLLAEDPPREEKAKIRAEALIRDDNMIEAYEILQLECELLHERIKLIQYSKTCPQDLVSVISTLIWASHRVDFEELNLIRKQFSAKYGKVFVEHAMRNVGGVLNERVVSKLSIEPPAAYLVQTYLERICEQFQVDWTPSIKLTADDLVEPMAAPSGYSVPVAQGTGLGPSNPGPIATTPNYPASTGADDPSVSVPPVAPSVPLALPTAPAFKTDMFDEPEIFVPGGAKKPTEKNDNDDEDSQHGDDALRSSLADLQAKFDELKNPVEDRSLGDEDTEEEDRYLEDEDTEMDEEDTLTEEDAAIRIQTLYRRIIATRYDAAVRIQTVYRRIIATRYVACLLFFSVYLDLLLEDMCSLAGSSDQSPSSPSPRLSAQRLQ